MVNFRKYLLPNGLKVILHEDTTTPIVAINILYDVGARDEDPSNTGFAHLFEHLMFEGSVNIPDFDRALQMAGGENNAFTNNDITNYYLTIPRQNLETALWLESDRMLGLAFSEEKLKVQKNIVTEEYRQSYLAQPYGDLWLHLRPLIYKVHPYQWPTIGKSIEHVQNATLDQVKEFYQKYYKPSNAIMVISGDIDYSQTIDLVDKWFTDIPGGTKPVRNIPQEPLQTEFRHLAVEKDVPFDEVYVVFRTGKRQERSFYLFDLITDVLAGGQSGRLNERLVKQRKVFSEINAWISGSLDGGFLAVNGKLPSGQNPDDAVRAVWDELNEIANYPISDYELQKVKNKLEATNLFAEAGILSKSMNLAWYELLGDAGMLNEQTAMYMEIGADELVTAARQVFTKENSSVFYYLARK